MRLPLEQELTDCVAGRILTTTVLAEKCPSCGETYITPAVLKQARDQTATSLAREGLPHGESFRRFRETLGLKAADLADVLGIAPETICRWEKGRREMDRFVWFLVAQFVLERVDKKADFPILKRWLSMRRLPPNWVQCMSK